MSDPHQHDNANDHPTPSCCAPSAPHETPSKPQPAAAPNTTVSAPSRPTIALPGGTFLMGTDYRDAFPFDGEGPIRPVSLSPFRIDTYPVTNRDFARTLGRVLGRPAILPMPAFAARLVFGEMADALLLSSQRVEPARLLASGYRFLHPDLEPALRHLLDSAAS